MKNTSSFSQTGVESRPSSMTDMTRQTAITPNGSELINRHNDKRDQSIRSCSKWSEFILGETSLLSTMASRRTISLQILTLTFRQRRSLAQRQRWQQRRLRLRNASNSFSSCLFAKKNQAYKHQYQTTAICLSHSETSTGRRGRRFKWSRR